MAIARRMLTTLAHRGPDGQSLQSLDDGRLVLGHARLAIIDLSSTGVQPMALNGGDIWITLNGEIYNHKALRRELEAGGYVFRSSSDTEVLLAGYARWGEAMLDRLDGIFAFGLWDGPKRRLWLVRDHLGVKPLYYLRDAKNFAFASEPKALLDLTTSRPTPDRASINDFLTFGYIPGSRSAFKEIAKLPGGHALVWENDRIRTYRYWDPNAFASDELRDESDVVEETMRLLDISTESQLESDVPVGVLVSGGIDSSAVASSVSRTRGGMEGFVVGFDDPAYDEREYARQLAHSCGIRLHERVVASRVAESLIAQMVAVHDEPFADSSSLPCLALFQMVRDQGFKTVLGGDGGDELFAGYRRYDKLAEVEGLSQAPWPLKLAGVRHARQFVRLAMRPTRYAGSAWRSYYEGLRFFSFDQQCALLQPDWRPVSEEQLAWPFESYWNPEVDTVKAAQLFDLQTYLQEDILTKVDRTSMRWGVESRVPLLARRIVTIALRTSSDVHRRGGRRKNVLKRGLEGRIPSALLSNRKKGFSLPLEATIGPLLRNWVASIEQSTLVRDGVIVPRLPADVLQNVDKIWTLFALDSWWSRWGRGTVAPAAG